MRRAIVAMTCGLGLAACGGGDDASAIDAAGGIDGAGGVSLATGQWSYATYDRTTDSCGGGVDGDGDFTIDATSSVSFHITRESTPASACTVNGSGFFTCTTPDEVQDRRPNDDAVFRASLALSGHVTTTTLASGMQTITVSCSGTDCAQLMPGASPCTVAADIAISHR